MSITKPYQQVKVYSPSLGWVLVECPDLISKLRSESRRRDLHKMLHERDMLRATIGYANENNPVTYEDEVRLEELEFMLIEALRESL